MSQILKKVIASLCLLTLPLSGASAYCNRCTPFVNVEFDFLYWKPCVENLNYAGLYVKNEEIEVVDFEYKDIKPKWQPGFRLSASIPSCFCNWDLSASFTYIQSQDQTCCKINEDFVEEVYFLTSPLIHPFVFEISGHNFFDIVKGDWKAKYYNPDLLFTYHISQGPCLDICPYFGVAGLYLDQELVFTGIESGFSEDIFAYAVDWKANVWGVGFKFGCGIEQEITNCLSLIANGSASLLGGKTDKIKNKQIFNEEMISSDEEVVPVDEGGVERQAINASYTAIPSIFADEESCLFLPGYHLQAGIKYTSQVCGCQTAFRVGYEFVNWHNVPNPRIFSSVLDEGFSPSQSTSPNTRAFGFHGLFLGLDAAF